MAKAVLSGIAVLVLAVGGFMVWGMMPHPREQAKEKAELDQFNYSLQSTDAGLEMQLAQELGVVSDYTQRKDGIIYFKFASGPLRKGKAGTDSAGIAKALHKCARANDLGSYGDSATYMAYPDCIEPMKTVTP